MLPLPTTGKRKEVLALFKRVTRHPKQGLTITEIIKEAFTHSSLQWKMQSVLWLRLSVPPFYSLIQVYRGRDFAKILLYKCHLPPGTCCSALHSNCCPFCLLMPILLFTTMRAQKLKIIILLLSSVTAQLKIIN